MHADLKGALEQINKVYKAFEHKGQRMSKEQVRAVLKYGINKGYETTAEITDKEVDEILDSNKKQKSSGPDSFNDSNFMMDGYY